MRLPRPTIHWVRQNRAPLIHWHRKRGRVVGSSWNRRKWLLRQIIKRLDATTHASICKWLWAWHEDAITWRR